MCRKFVTGTVFMNNDIIMIKAVCPGAKRGNRIF